jgi:hypothetical protein
MLFFQFPEDARWNATAEAVEFSVILGPYEGTVRVPKSPSRGCSTKRRHPNGVLRPFISNAPGSR